MVNAPFRWEPMGEWLHSGHAQLVQDVEMLQYDDIEMPYPQLHSDLLQIFQQDRHRLDQYLDWLLDPMGQECPMNGVDAPLRKLQEPLLDYDVP